jgi:hypothetical protein
MSNPFSPAPGALPARIVGREPELSAIREAIRRAESGSPPVPLVFLGQRGMGKTVLLRELRDLGARRALAVPLEVVKGESLAGALREKLDDLVASVETLPARVGHALEKTLRSLPTLSYELPHEGGSISLGRPDEDPVAGQREPLAAMVRALMVAARAAKRYIVFTLDEIQDVDVRSMGTLVRCVHESAQSDSPILLACAGLSESHAVLEKLRTYVQRWNSFDLRLLTESETIEAIREPIVAAATAIGEPALELLVREAAGYPFYIQAYGSAVWEQHRGSKITLADVQAALPPVRLRNEAAFYVRPLARISPRETAFALALADFGPGSHEVGAVARALGLAAPDVSSMRATLVRKGIVAVPVPGRVEFRIPFTDRYLRDHQDEYETPDVRAYRQRIARRLRPPATEGDPP